MAQIFYTNAPKDYDYHFVTELDADLGRFTSGTDCDKPIRRVMMTGDSWQIDSQRMRYSSGLYPSLTEEEIAVWEDNGWFVPNPPGDENDGDLGWEPPPPPDDSASCDHCSATHSIDDIGTTCRTCGRGIITSASGDEIDEDELDYLTGQRPGSWCEDDSKGEA
jgi:hypothetical protein